MTKSLFLIGLLIFSAAPLVWAQTAAGDQPFSGLNELDQFLTQDFSPLEKDYAPGQMGGQWRFQAGGREIIVMADEDHNRIRVMTSASQIDPRDARLLFTLLEANFGRALDARYAITKDVLWSLFLHPLKDCKPSQLKEGIRQVVTLADNTGTTYASSELSFGEG